MEYSIKKDVTVTFTMNAEELRVLRDIAAQWRAEVGMRLPQGLEEKQRDMVDYLVTAFARAIQ